MLRVTPFVVLLLLGAGAASAQTKVGPEFRINNRTEGAQYQGDVAALSNGGFFARWQQPAGSELQAYARCYDADGKPSGRVMRFNPFASVAGLANGNFIAVWSSSVGNGQVRGRIYDASCAPTGPEFRLSQRGDGPARVQALNGGGFLVIWGGCCSGENQTTLFARRFTAQGTPVGSQFELDETERMRLYIVAIEPSGAAGFVVIWAGIRSTGRLFFRRAFPDSGAPSQVSRVDTGGFSPQASAALSGGGFIFAWGDDAAGGIYARRYGSDGMPAGPAFLVNTIDEDEYLPVAVGLSGGDFVIAWTRDDQVSYRIFARRYDSSGQPLTGEFQVNTAPLGDTTGSSLAPLASGGFVAAWSLSRSSNYDVHAQRFGP